MKTPRFSHILLATDGSQEAMAAVDLSIAFAKAAATTVIVVHVWNLEVHQAHGEWDIETRPEAEKLIDDAVTRLSAAGVRASGQILHADVAHVASAIAEAARQAQADLVVVGSRGLSDWQSMLKHSVSHQLLTAVDCPVLVVRAKPPVSSGSRRILAAIAGCDDVHPAVRAAIAAGSGVGAEVLVVHVAQTLVGAQGFAYVEPQEEIHATVDKALSLLKEAGISCEAMVAHAGPVAQVVAQ